MALGCVPTNSAKLRSSPCAWRCSNPNTSCTAPPNTFPARTLQGAQVCGSPVPPPPGELVRGCLGVPRKPLCFLHQLLLSLPPAQGLPGPPVDAVGGWPPEHRSHDGVLAAFLR